MKRFIVFSLVFVLLFSCFVCAAKGGNASPPGLEDKEVKGQGVDKASPVSAKENKSSGGGSSGRSGAADSQTQGAQVLDQLRNKTRENTQLLEAKLVNVSNRDKLKVFRNQNTVREAVMNLLALREAGNFSGGIGQDISAIARGFDNSVNKTVEAEEAIQNRGGVMRLLFGGDENAAATIQSELNQNRVRLQQLQRVRTQLDPEYQGFVDEQVQLMEEEQERLRLLAEQEQADKGLLGWLFK